MNRLWSRIGVRAASVGLLLTGLVGGVYLERDPDVQLSAASPDMAQVDASDMQMLKKRQGQHAAARAWQRQAEGDAATKAASMAQTIATKAKKLDTKVVAAKKAAAVRKKAEQNGGPVPYTGPIPSSCNEYSGSRAIGCTLTFLRSRQRLSELELRGRCLERGRP